MNKYKKYLNKIKDKMKNMWKEIRNTRLFSPGKLSIKKQTFFAKRLSFLIKSGEAMVESITLIKEQTKSKSEIAVYEQIIFDIKNGKSLANSLERCCGIFGNFAVNIIRAGESSGTLTQNLNYLAEELKKKELLRKKIISALLYPIIITVATFGITGFLVIYIFPKILPIFQSLKAQLPLSTRIIIYISNFIRNDWFYILIVIIMIRIGLYFLKRYSYRVRFILDGFILRFPLVGNIAKNYNFTNICRTLGLLLKSGIPVTQALAITSETTENLQYKKVFYEISCGVIKGKTISEFLRLYPSIFTEMIVHTISIGEKSGNLSETLIYLSEYYENEFDDMTKNLSSSIEPILMIVMGVTVGFVAISVITPIYEITNSLHK